MTTIPADIFGRKPGIRAANLNTIRRAEGERLEIRLSDPPPSSNNMFANVPGKGRVKSKLYTLWIEAAGWEARQQAKVRVGGPVMIDITIFRLMKTADIDNRIKAVCDLLVVHDLIDDDKHVVEVRARWTSEHRGCRIVVERIQDIGRAA